MLSLFVSVQTNNSGVKTRKHWLIALINSTLRYAAFKIIT